MSCIQYINNWIAVIALKAMWNFKQERIDNIIFIKYKYNSDLVLILYKTTFFLFYFLEKFVK